MDVQALQFHHLHFSEQFGIPGKLESTAVLKAICAGFKESTEPHVCLTPGQLSQWMKSQHYT
jgi:hypothetical protein